MSLVDTRFPDLDLFLQHWRRRLNARFLWGEALTALCVAAPMAALATFAAPNPVFRFGLWTTLAAASAGVYVLARSKRRLSRHQAAGWLDEAARTTGLFRAASECLEQENPGYADGKVLAEADQRRAAFTPRTSPRLPARRLMLRVALAAAVTLGSFWLLTVGAPSVFRIVQAETTRAEKPAEPETQTELEAGSRTLSPAEAAKRLFPEDARLAALAEQALASGDPGALDALLDQNAGADRSAARSGGAAGGSGKSRSDQDTSGQRQTPTQEPPDGTRKAGAGSRESGSESGSGKKEKSGAASSGKDGTQTPPKGSGGGGSGLQSGAGDRGEGQSGQGQGGKVPFGSGGTPGTGHSEETFGSFGRGSSDFKLPLKESGNPGLFEYVLPGSESKLPSAQALADSRRSAEAVLSRQAPPLEFENTIRDYFLSLSQEVSP